jgi:hypothetical protein
VITAINHETINRHRSCRLPLCGTLRAKVKARRSTVTVFPTWEHVVKSSQLCLSPLELRELSGYTVHRAQCHWLETNQFRFVIDRCGRPKVLRAVVEARLGAIAVVEDLGPTPEPALSTYSVRPDFLF